jgi:hypothetical protein
MQRKWPQRGMEHGPAQSWELKIEVPQPQRTAYHMGVAQMLNINAMPRMQNGENA